MKSLRVATISLLVAIVLSSVTAQGQNTGEICGIGAVVEPDAQAGTPTLKAVVVDHINIMKVNTGSPSEVSGLQKGDGIIAINGASIAGMNFYDVVTKLIRGNAGTTVTITVKRQGSAVPISFTMVREPVSVQP